MEVQLIVLRECLVTNKPLLINTSTKSDGVHDIDRSQPRGQNDLGWNILRTCRLYYKEGMKLLYENNSFSYTAAYNSPNERLSTPGTPPFRNLRHLILRPSADSIGILALNAFIGSLSWLAHLPYLLTLRVDLLGFRQYDCTGDPRERYVVEGLLEGRIKLAEAHKVDRRYCEEWRSTNSGLRQFIITGLGLNYATSMIIKKASYLLANNGKLGFGIGPRGQRYVLKMKGSQACVMALPEPPLIWLEGNQIDSWIEQNRKSMDPEGLYDILENGPPGLGH